MTPHEVYDQVVTGVHGLLKPLRFAKSGTTFRRVGGETTHIVSIEKDQRYTRRDSIPFVVGLGIVINDMFEVGGRPAEVKKASEADAHVRFDVGWTFEPQRSFDWEITEATDGPALVDEVVGAVRDGAIPFFQRYSTKASIVAEWRAGRAMGQSDYTRRVFLARIDGTVIDDDAPKYDKDTMLAAFRAGDYLGFPEHTAKEMLAFLEKDAARRAAKKAISGDDPRSASKS